MVVVGVPGSLRGQRGDPGVSVGATEWPGGGVPRRVPGIRWGRRSWLGSQSCHSGGPRGSQMLEGSQSGWGGGPNWGPRGQGGGTGGVLEVWEGSQVSEWGSQRVSRGWKDPEVTVGVPWGSGWGLWGVPGVKEGPWGGGQWGRGGTKGMGRREGAGFGVGVSERFQRGRGGLWWVWDPPEGDGGRGVPPPPGPASAASASPSAGSAG